MFLLLSVALLVASVLADCPSSLPVALGLPKCADYPEGYFINDFSNCQSYFFCPNATSPPYPGKCLKPYNFDQTNQICNHPDVYSCLSSVAVEDSVAVADYVSVAVNTHNQYRSRHGSPNVSARSTDINTHAQNWANYLAKTDKFIHSNGPYGENLYKIWGGSTDKNSIIADAIRAFYSEIKYYDWKHPGFSMKTGHFTQLIWKSSIEIGVGIATFPDKRYKQRTVVCINYRPPGNVSNQFSQNVLPPRVSLDYINDDFDSTINNEDEKPK
ncbi:Protein PRY2, partial [Pseudolycoriella hygida]